MNTNMNVTIRRLTNTFILFFLILSGVAAYIQLDNHAFVNGPELAASQYDPRHCPPYDQPLRGTIYDRNGVKLAWSMPDPTAVCGYRRKYADPSLSPLLGYFSYHYGVAGIEATYNDILSGVGHGESVQDPVNKLLHKPRYGQDIYLTIDDKVQQKANGLYDTSAIYGGVCQPQGSSPPGSIIVEDPNSGELLAMVNRPFYDQNKIADADSLDTAVRANGERYWASINSDPGRPLLNHATQGLYAPGSTFKTATMLAALDSGQLALDTQFTKDEATNVVVNGEPIRWDDYFAGVWNGLVNFPLTFEQGYAYSDNVVYARAAVTIGADTWLSYIRKLGIATPGTQVPRVPFDAPYAQSTAFNAKTDGKPTSFNQNLLAESGFGQGQLLISPLTMAEITSTVAANGLLYQPHVVWKTATHDTAEADALPAAPQVYSGGPVVRPETAAAVRHAMWSVVQFGTAWAGLTRDGIHLSETGTFEGGKTGTAQLESGNPNTWWISLAPDDQAQGGNGRNAQYVITVSKERSGEGACQVFVADDLYKSILK
jgi:penicillin-binding protein A